jgi:hypothetical protein
MWPAYLILHGIAVKIHLDETMNKKYKYKGLLLYLENDYV